MKFRAAALIAAASVITSAAVCAQMPTVVPAVPVAPPPAASQWRAMPDATGTAYETGTLDQPIDGGLRIACMSDGAARLVAQIKGVAPAAGSRFLLIPATRQGRSQSFTFTAGADGTVKIARARADRQLARLWPALRGGNNVTLRFADGSFAVQSLAGARATLPTGICG